MADLMRGRAAEIEVRGGAAGEGVSEDIAAVLVEGGGTAGRVGGEVADAEEAAAEVGEEVDV